MEGFHEQKSALGRCLYTAVMSLACQMAEINSDEVYKANGQYLHYLKKCEILPHKNSLDERSFSTIVERASKLESCHFKACNRKRCDCYRISGMDLKKELQDGIEERAAGHVLD